MNFASAQILTKSDGFHILIIIYLFYYDFFSFCVVCVYYIEYRIFGISFFSIRLLLLISKQKLLNAAKTSIQFITNLLDKVLRGVELCI